MQPEYNYDLFHSNASSLFPNQDSYDRSTSAPPIQGLQQRTRDMKLPSQQHQQQYDTNQTWQLWKNGGVNGNKK